MFVVCNADLVFQEQHRPINTVRNSLDDQAVDVVLVGDPLWRLFVWFNVILGILHQFMDFLAVVAYVLETGAD